MDTTMTVHLPVVPKKVGIKFLPSIHELSAHELGEMKGYKEGWAKAQTECRQEMEQKIQTSRAHWDSIAKALNTIPREVILRLQGQLVDFTFQAIRKILAATPVTREEISVQIKQMLEKAEAGAKIEVQLNPEDLALLTQEDQAALANENLSHLSWLPNSAIQRGGCILKGEFGCIDGRRETRLERIEKVTQESIGDSQKT